MCGAESGRLALCLKEVVRPATVLAFLLSAAAAGPAGADIAEDAEQHGDIEVGAAVDSAAQSGSVNATVRIHARREVVWPLVTSCEVALETVPGLAACEVLDAAPDRTWQRIRQVIDYSWYLPRLTYELRASYEYPSRVSIERVAGDLRSLKGSWYLESDGDFTVAHYSLDLAPGFWVPRWLVRAALRRDLPKMLRALRARAESSQQGAVQQQGAARQRGE
jgi:Polyketide cyclase / dehydrase and lipid transport